MQPFELITVTTVPDAVKAQAGSPNAQQERRYASLLVEPTWWIT
jgi:hypothetical protein